MNRSDAAPRSGRSLHAPRTLLGLLLLMGAAASSWSCGRGESAGSDVPPVPEPVAAAAWDDPLPAAGWNFVLITLDTTRRDAVGAYGRPFGATPVLDSLAAEGVLFEEMVTPVPITCPAHATLMTGYDPYEHGVRHNGLYTLSDSLITLAERFRAVGYETAAFVSGYPLSRRFGLAQGFDHYDDAMTRNTLAAAQETAERTADEVTDAALAWAAGGPGSPLFVWVHYFDPHFPYEAPEPFASRFPADPYHAEVAFTDREVGRLIRGLGAVASADSTFLLVVGDHGESLGEHQESTHSFFVYDATQLVPCLLIPPPRWSGPPLAGRRVSEQTRLRDLAPTVAHLMGWDARPWSGTGSASLVALASGRGSAPAPVAYVETLAPALDYGWSDLRGVRTPGWKYIRAPRPELYRLAGDAVESENVHDREPDVAARMDAWLDFLLGGESDRAIAPAEVDGEALERLRSLGYLGGGVQGAGSGADPKDRIQFHAALNSARQLGAEFRYEEAIQHLRPVVRHEPQLLEARRLLASFSYLSGDFETARSLYEGLLEADPANVRYRMQSVPVLVGLGEGEKALAVIDELERDAPNEEGLFALKGESLEALGRREDAIAAFRKDGELRPGRAAPRWHIAKILQTEGRTEEARRELERGLAEEPGHAATLSALADAAYAEGNEALGDTLVARALASDRLEPNANLLRGWRAHQAGDLQAAREAYEVAVRVKPRFAKARYNLGTVWLALRRPEEAREQFAAALESGQETADVRLNLGVALAQLQRIEDAMDEWERALELNPDPATANRLQQNIALARRALGQKTP